MISHWHLHATVVPHWSWSLTDTAGALQRDIAQLGSKLVHVVNLLRDGGKRPELIPTQHYEGTEMEAVRQLFEFSHILQNKGWQVQRLKIEGDPRHVPHERALYFEAHRKILPHEISSYIGRPISVTKNSTMVTLRRKELPHLIDLLVSMSLAATEVEICTLDTNEESDAGWIS